MNSTSGRRPRARSRALAALATTLLGVGLLAGCDAGAEAPAAVVTGTPTTGLAGATEPSPDETIATDATGDATDDASESDEAQELTYPGQDGRTALELLLEADPSAEVTGEGDQVFVTAIGGRAADPTGEFWALYVNGEPSSVGAGSLVTQEGDEITWKLETF